MNSGKPQVLPGALEVTLPLAIKGGPAVLLTLRSHVVLPDIAPSVTSLDFGTVQSSHCKVSHETNNGAAMVC